MNIILNMRRDEPLDGGGGEMGSEGSVDGSDRSSETSRESQSPLTTLIKGEMFLEAQGQWL